MASTWLKIKMWTRLSLIVAVLIYVLVFIFENRSTDIDIDFVFKKYHMNILTALLLTAVFSIFGWWLFKTVLRALRQLNDINRKAKMERLEKEHSDMLAKASKLQTRTEPPPPS